MTGMPINALIDMLQGIMPELQRMGDVCPQIDIHNPVELVALFNIAAGGITDKGLRAVIDDHISLFRDAMVMKVEP